MLKFDIKTGKLFIIVVLRLSLFVQLLYSRSGSIITSPRDKRGGRGQGSFISFFEKKETKDRTTSVSFASSVLPFPLFAPTHPPSSLLLSPLDQDPSSPLILSRGRDQGSSTSFPEEKETDNHEAALFSPATPPTPSAEMCVLLRCPMG